MVSPHNVMIVLRSQSMKLPSVGPLHLFRILQVRFVLSSFLFLQLLSNSLLHFFVVIFIAIILKREEKNRKSLALTEKKKQQQHNSNKISYQHEITATVLITVKIGPASSSFEGGSREFISSIGGKKRDGVLTM